MAMTNLYAVGDGGGIRIRRFGLGHDVKQNREEIMRGQLAAARTSAHAMLADHANQTLNSSPIGISCRRGKRL